MALVPSSSRGGYSTTSSVTTNANTFIGDLTIDLGGFAVVYMLVTAHVLTGGGETFGTGAGNVGLGINLTQASLDGVTYKDATPLTPAQLRVIDANGFMSVVGQYETFSWATPRFALLETAIYDSNAGTVYAGANHPQATATVAITGLTR